MSIISIIFVVLTVALFASTCTAQGFPYSPETLKAMATRDTQLLTEAQGVELDKFWLKINSSVFEKCRSQYPKDKTIILLIIKNDLSGKINDIWTLGGGPVSQCLVESLQKETMPKPPFEPFFSPLYATP